MRHLSRILAIPLLCASSLVGAACVTNPVGPVSTASAYQEKADRTVQAAASAVASVRLAVQAEIDGGSFTAFTSGVVDDALGQLRTAEDTFETITPPEPFLVDEQQKTLAAVGRSRSAVVDALTALQSGADISRLTEVVAGLDGATNELDALGSPK